VAARGRCDDLRRLGHYEQDWTAVQPRLDRAASRYAEGWLDRENVVEGIDPHIAYSVDIERS
jgi:hypothetical protein